MAAEFVPIEHRRPTRRLHRTSRWLDKRLSRNGSRLLLRHRMVRGNVIHVRLGHCLHGDSRVERCHGRCVRGSGVRHKVRLVGSRDSMIGDVRVGGEQVAEHRWQYDALRLRFLRLGIHHFRDRRPCVQIL